MSKFGTYNLKQMIKIKLFRLWEYQKTISHGRKLLGTYFKAYSDWTNILFLDVATQRNKKRCRQNVCLKREAEQIKKNFACGQLRNGHWYQKYNWLVRSFF